MQPEPKPQNGRAFPTHQSAYDGMTLRDYFAAKALAGLLAFSPPDCEKQLTPTEAAKDAYAYADAMLIARK